MNNDGTYEVMRQATTALYSVVRNKPTAIAKDLRLAEAEALAKALNEENKGR
jgi:hypothetical protein